MNQPRENLLNADARRHSGCSCTALVWLVLSTDGVRSGVLYRQEAAEREAALLRGKEPGELFWVSPWPRFLAEASPEAPWAGLPRPAGL